MTVFLVNDCAVFSSKEKACYAIQEYGIRKGFTTFSFSEKYSVFTLIKNDDESGKEYLSLMEVPLDGEIPD